MNGENIDVKEKSNYLGVFKKILGHGPNKKTLTNAKGSVAILSLAKCVSEPLFFPTPPQGATGPIGPGPPHPRSFTITLRHTTLVWTRDQSDAETST